MDEEDEKITLATAATWKNDNGYNKSNETVYFPLVKGTDDKIYHLSVLAAANFQELLVAQDGIPYVTATHDRQNPLSGRVMVRLGMRYCYSYEEQWQPKDFPVVFRLYQLNLDGQAGRVYEGYRQAEGARWFVEQNVPTAQGSLL